MDRRIKSGGDIGEAERTHHRRSYCVDPTGVAHLRWLTSSALGVAAARAEVAAFLADQAGAAALGALGDAGAAVRAAQVHHRALLLAGQRSDERRVGKECVSTGRSRGLAYH